MIFVCHSWYVLACAVRIVWYGRRPLGQCGGAMPGVSCDLHARSEGAAPSASGTGSQLAEPSSSFFGESVGAGHWSEGSASVLRGGS